MRNFLMCCFMILAVVITVTFFLTYPEQDPPPDVPEQQFREGSYDYLLKTVDGKLAVFAAREDRPRKVFEVYVATLPLYDQKQLERGVPVKDYEELLKRLEDYSS